MKKTLLTIILVLSAAAVIARPRAAYTINESWEFSRDAVSATDSCAWTVVNIPHTWNAADAEDDVPGMYRGGAWYRKSVAVPESFADRRVIIYFEGANQETSLYVNGTHVGDHIGGYTRFCFDITPYVEFGKSSLFPPTLPFSEAYTGTCI